MIALIHYGEIALKGNNRPSFEKRLEEAIRLSLKARVKREQGLITAAFSCTNDEARERLSRIFGIVWFSFCTETGTSIEEIKASCLQEIGDFKGTFKVDCSRSDKRYPMTSMQVNQKVGEYIIEKKGLKVSLKNPGKLICIEIGSKARVYSERYSGPGGLPVGSAGKALCLLSGGIDSPAAAWMMMKRGCKIDFLHFHALRENEEVNRTKITEIAKALKVFSPFSRLYVIPYYPFEPLSRNGRYDLVIFRRFMVSVAQRVALMKKCGALVTGESLSQVASQTLENMSCIDDAASIPTLRPVVGMDKEEIISLAKKIGTYELSIKDYRDCCSLIARHPATKASLGTIKALEDGMDIKRAADQCISLLSEITSF